MPLYMDIHENLPDGASAKDVSAAHAADVEKQEQYGVKYQRYWVDEKQRKVFCLVEAPDAETAARCGTSLPSPRSVDRPDPSRRRSRGAPCRPPGAHPGGPADLRSRLDPA